MSVRWIWEKREVTNINLWVQSTYKEGVVFISMADTRVNFRLPEELVQKADVAAEINHMNRTEIVREALRQYLQQVEDDKKFKEAVIELYLDQQISFDVLKEFIGKQDAEAVKASKTILSQGEELADELAEQ